MSETVSPPVDTATTAPATPRRKGPPSKAIFPGSVTLSDKGEAEPTKYAPVESNGSKTYSPAGYSGSKHEALTGVNFNSASDYCLFKAEQFDIRAANMRQKSQDLLSGASSPEADTRKVQKHLDAISALRDNLFAAGRDVSSLDSMLAALKSRPSV